MSRKVTVYLEPDEAVVVGPIPQWKHLIEVYNTLGDEAAPEDSDYWYEAAQWIRSSLNNKA